MIYFELFFVQSFSFVSTFILYIHVFCMWISIISSTVCLKDSFFLIIAFTRLSKISSLYLCMSIGNQLTCVSFNLVILLLIPNIISVVVGFQMFYIDSQVILFLVSKSVHLCTFLITWLGLPVQYKTKW